MVRKKKQRSKGKLIMDVWFLLRVLNAVLIIAFFVYLFSWVRARM